MSSGSISVVIEEPAWRKAGVDLARLRTAARLALARGCAVRTAPLSMSSGAMTLLLADDGRLRELNARFRGKDAPTNVLSFRAVADAHGYLGDVAIALGITQIEAAAAGISLMAHALHLAVHGVLHLLGYDHAGASEARRMEELEIAILAELDVANPYARTRGTN